MFVLNIENSESQPNFAQLRSRLIMYEERINQQAEFGEKSVPVSAMTAERFGEPPPHNASKERSNGVLCQICRKQGYSADRCYFRYNSQDSNQSRNNGGGRTHYGGRFGVGWRGQDFRNHRGGRFGGNRGRFGEGRNPNVTGYFVGTENGETFGPYSQPNFCGGPVNNGPNDTSWNYVGSNSFHQAGPHAPNSGAVDLQGQQPHHAYSTEFGPAHFAKWAAQRGTSANLSFADTCEMVDSWIPDSGATTHMTPNPHLVQGVVAYTGPERVIVGNGHSLRIFHIGHAFISLSKCRLVLKCVLLVPELTKIFCRFVNWSLIILMLLLFPCLACLFRLQQGLYSTAFRVAMETFILSLRLRLCLRICGILVLVILRIMSYKSFVFQIQ